MKVNSTHDSSWILRATVNNYIENDVSFAIVVHELEKEDADDMVSFLMFNSYYYMFLSIHASLDAQEEHRPVTHTHTHTHTQNYKIFRYRAPIQNLFIIFFFYEAQDHHLYIYHFPFILFRHQQYDYRYLRVIHRALAYAAYYVLYRCLTPRSKAK